MQTREQRLKNCGKLLGPNTSGTDDPLINPAVEYSKLRSMGCNRLMVVLPAKDILKHRGRYYAEKLGGERVER